MQGKIALSATDRDKIGRDNAVKLSALKKLDAEAPALQSACAARAAHIAALGRAGYFFLFCTRAAEPHTGWSAPLPQA